MNISLDTIIEGYKTVATQYNVSAAIFIAIYVIMTPLYYYGIYRIAKVSLKYRHNCKRKKTKPNIHKLFKQKGFLNGYVMNRVSWAAPYGYVIFWGDNLPTRFYLLIFTWMAVGMYIFYHSIERKMSKK